MVEPEPNALARMQARRPWVTPALVGGLLGVATAYTAWKDPTTQGIFPVCPLREATGLDCPGCGGTRAVHALTQGDIGTAFDHNAVFTVVVPLLAVAWAVWMVHAIRVTRARRRGGEPPRRPVVLAFTQMSHRGWVGVVVFLVAFAVLRNISAVPVLDFLGSPA